MELELMAENPERRVKSSDQETHRATGSTLETQPLEVDEGNSPALKPGEIAMWRWNARANLASPVFNWQ